MDELPELPDFMSSRSIRNYGISGISGVLLLVVVAVTVLVCYFRKRMDSRKYIMAPAPVCLRKRIRELPDGEMVVPDLDVEDIV